MSSNRMIEHNGYNIVAYDNGDIIIYRKGRFVMQALCWKGMSDEDVITEAEKLLEFREKLNNGGSYM